jgi:hypothetical protein
MVFVLASDILESLGQAAAVILVLFLIFSTIMGLALTLVLMLGLSWLRDNLRLIHSLPILLRQINSSLVAGRLDKALPDELQENQLLQNLARVPHMAQSFSGRANNVEHSVDNSSDKVTSSVIEFHARTAQAKGILKAFFLPGLTPKNRTQQVASVQNVEAITINTSDGANSQVETEKYSEQAINTGRELTEGFVQVNQQNDEQPPMEQEIVIRLR